MSPAEAGADEAAQTPCGSNSLPALLQDERQISARHLVAGIEFECALEAADRRRAIAGVEMEDAEIVVRFREAWLQAHRGFETGFGPVRLVQSRERIAQIIVRRGEVRLERNRRAGTGGGIGGATQLQQDDREVVVGVSMTRVEAQHGFETRYGVVWPAGLEEGFAQVVVGVCEIR